jgi:SAM-dependent methyltransferase
MRLRTAFELSPTTPQTDSARHADSYGNGCAEFYDEIYAPASRAAIDRLAQLAGDGRVLEAGVGTGRYALPLAARGVSVYGIDASAAMLDVLRRKAGAESVVTTLGDFSATSVGGTFRLIVCLTNTLTLLPDAARQESALARFASALSDDGAVLIETTHAPGTAESATTDIALETRHGPRRYRVRCRDVDNAALDTWAVRAGLRCAERWRDWRGTPWRGEHGTVLSLFQKKPLATHPLCAASARAELAARAPKASRNSD